MCEAQSAIHETLQCTSLQSKELQHISVQVHCKVIITIINAVLMHQIRDYVWGSKCYTWNITIHKFAVKRAAAYLGTGTLQSSNHKNKCSSDASNPSMAIHVWGSKHYMKHYNTQVCSQRNCSIILVHVHGKITVDILQSKRTAVYLGTGALESNSWQFRVKTTAANLGTGTLESDSLQSNADAVYLGAGTLQDYGCHFTIKLAAAYLHISVQVQCKITVASLLSN